MLSKRSRFNKGSGFSKRNQSGNFRSDGRAKKLGSLAKKKGLDV